MEGRADTASEKIERLTEAGIAVAEKIEDMPALLEQQLAAGV